MSSSRAAGIAQTESAYVRGGVDLTHSVERHSVCISIIISLHEAPRNFDTVADTAVVQSHANLLPVRLSQSLQVTRLSWLAQRQTDPSLLHLGAQPGIPSNLRFGECPVME